MSSPTTSKTPCRSDLPSGSARVGAGSSRCSSPRWSLPASRAAATARSSTPRRRRPAGSRPPAVPLPNKEGSFKFAVLGDFGTGSRTQYSWPSRWPSCTRRSSTRSWRWSATTSTAASGPRTSVRSSRCPYKPLLDAGVKFYASLGNHDAREQRYYKLFNMDGKLYYTFSPQADVRFFMLESTYPEPEQIKWLEEELKASSSKWKIPVFHHPLYSSGDRHGSDLRLREVLEPLFLKYNVSVVLTGHDHFYERVKPQKGIVVFRGRIRRPAAGRQHRSLDRPDRPRLRHRPGLHGRRDRRRHDEFQRRVPPRPDRGFRSDCAPAVAALEVVAAALTRTPLRVGASERVHDRALTPRHVAGQRHMVVVHRAANQVAEQPPGSRKRRN